MPKRPGAPLSPRAKAWLNSPEFHTVRIEALRRFNRKRLNGTRCGATAKSTGRQCQQPSMANGKCRFHGGRTPSGTEWHVVQYKRKDKPGAMARVDAKAARYAKTREKRRQSVVLMTEERRAAHKKWQSTHQPGSPGARARLRAERKANAEFRARMERPAPPSEESLRPERITERLKRIDERAARIKAKRPKPPQGAFA